MTDYSPGPWQVSLSRNKFGGTQYGIKMHTHTMVCVEHDGSYWPLSYEPKTDDDGYYLPDDEMDCHSQRLVNARLIASAPDLVDALEGLVKPNSNLPSHAKARDALAKAKGGEG